MRLLACSALVLAAAFLAGCGSSTCGGTNEMCRLAGSGVQSYGAAGAPALKTALYWVSSVKKGPDGRIYLVDQNNYRVLVIDKDGRLEVFAGTGVHAGFIVGAMPTASPFLDPLDLIWRPDGSVAILSWHDARLAAIGTDGKMEVVAGLGHSQNDALAFGCVDSGDGGPALEAGFCELAAMAQDQKGNVFIADDLANQISMIDASGTFHLLAGDGMPGYKGDGGPATAAELNGPEALAVDNDGNVLVADTSNNVIRKIDMTTRIVSTIVGNGSSGSAGDGGSCISASLDQPAGIAVAADGSLFLSDTYSSRIRHVDLGKDVIDAFAGTGMPGVTGDDGPALKAELKHPSRLSITDGVLYIADTLNNVARSVRF